MLESVDDNFENATEIIEWTAPRSGTYFVTVEDAFFGSGAYTIIIRNAD